MTSQGTSESPLADLARPSGTFAMVAIDQRESLRIIFAEEGAPGASEETLVAFKVAVARTLSPVASALLVDARLGLRPILEANALDARCGLIVAADDLEQEPGSPVEDTRIDTTVEPGTAASLGASALKLLVIWRDDARRADRLAMVAEFIARCRDAGLASVVEPVVRPSPGVALNAAIEDAARHVGGLGPDLYKSEVPFHGAAESEAITAAAERITDLMPGPWVVLSQGVDPATFPGAVEAACRGGASGFLAGRAVWRDAIGPDAATTEDRLRERAVPRLQALAATVDAVARPWNA
jgi:sulfofructosephosphate aldolase